MFSRRCEYLKKIVFNILGRVIPRVQIFGTKGFRDLLLDILVQDDIFVKAFYILNNQTYVKSIFISR